MNLRPEQSLRISAAQEEPGCDSPPQSPPAPASNEQAICQAYENGHSVEEVAREHGLSNVTVRKILVWCGVEIRPRGGGSDKYSQLMADQKVQKSLRPKHASAPQFSDAWFAQCNTAYEDAVRAAYPERGGV